MKDVKYRKILPYDGYKEDEVKPKEYNKRLVAKPMLYYDDRPKNKSKWSVLLLWFIVGVMGSMFLFDTNNPDVFISKTYFVFGGIILSLVLRKYEELE